MTTIPLLLLGALQLATPQRMLASTTDAVDLAAESAVPDTALIARDAGQPAQSWLGDPAWRALLGDLDGDGVVDLPEGIDALTFGPRPAGVERGPASLWFSVERDQAGVKDGDVLRLDGVGMLAVVHSEAELLAALQAPSGGLDLDALCRLADGSLLLSLRDGLNGTVLGDLQDGDLVRWDPASGAVALVADEAQVQAWVDHATGGATAIGDLKGVTRDASGELFFCVQAPSSDDATVYGNGGGGRVVSGWEEAAWGFQSAAELDALALLDAAGPLPMQLASTRTSYQSGDLAQLDLQYAQPHEQLVFAFGTHAAWAALPGRGFGLRVLDHQTGALLITEVGGALLLADAGGRATLVKQVPAVAAGAVELLVQAYGPISGLSAPLRLTVQ